MYLCILFDSFQMLVKYRFHPLKREGFLFNKTYLQHIIVFMQYVLLATDENVIRQTMFMIT